eukprot:TRINITY_DN240_c0_g1_i1.p1 TRINITY_DN240_c0_g1~~TRINITY_DN240_c0_g1_i1.p1  ORF type:complete len:476 (-),score=95.34 TRINITY_DN240_c0_g1_i1:459-1886(-)
MAEPSKVIHVRNVGPEISEQDLQQLAQSFGAPHKIVVLRAKNQALIEMNDLSSAIQMIQYYTTMQASVRGRNVYMQFSSHQELTNQDPAGRSKAEQDLQPNRILLVTIHNPIYPITVDVLHQVFSPYGFVEKIVVFQKSAGLQSLLQFVNQQSSIGARTALQGRNIYDGCCTLDIQFSNLQELQVNFNNERTRDYTNNNLPSEAGALRPPPGGNGNMISLFGEGGNMYGLPPPGGPRPGFQQGQPNMGPGMGLHPFQMPGLQSAAGAMAAFGGTLPPGVTGTNERCTILVSNLDEMKVDPDKLFNLFSNYGNVMRIKMLQNKPDHALVQMQDGLQAELAVNFLKGISLFGKRMDVNFSKHPQINTSPDTRDYSTSNLNRFTRNAAKNYRHCCAPTRMIHCSALPPDVTVETITEYLSPHGQIVGAKVYESQPAGKKQALVQFGTEEQATEALVSKHASPFNGTAIRLAFSKLATI